MVTMKVYRRFKPRLFIAVLALIVSFSLLVFRLFDVQLVRGESFWLSVEQNRWFELPVVPPRGVILDRFGMPIVENHRYYTKVENSEQIYSQAHLITQEEALQLIATDSARVRTHANRHYPYGEALAHVIGYVGALTQEDLQEDRSLQPFEHIGKSGLEGTFERQLRGQLGADRYEVDAQVRRQKKITIRPAVSGQNVHTSLDPILSEIAYRSLGDQRGVVAIADTGTGELLTLVSKPAYDPNAFIDLDPIQDEETRKAASQRIQSWFADETQPFFNRAVSGQYPPGSVFKLVTALAGLETDAVDLSTTVLDEGVLKVGDFSYANWYWTQFGRTEGEIDLVRALARSNDIYFYKAAEWIGPNKLAEMSRVFGLGTPVGIEIGGEAKGLVPDPAWKQAVVGEPWYLGNTYHYGIGQGDIKTTPLQLLQLTQAFGNKGTMCSPRLVKDDTVSCQELGVSEESINAVMQGMLEVCSPRGTAFPFFARNGAIYDAAGGFNALSVEEAEDRGAVACKTGTAEFGGENEQGFRKTNALWVGVVEPRLAEISAESRSDDSFLVAIENPREADEATLHAVWLQRIAQARDKGEQYPERFAFLVIVESDDADEFKEGSQDAAPVGAAILNWMESSLGLEVGETTQQTSE